MYEVIEYFTDLQDNGYAYNVGDEYPRQGYEPSEERIQELTTTNNKRHMVFIKPIDNENSPEDRETAETVAEVTAEETVDHDVLNNDVENIDEKPRKRKKREE